VWTLAKVADECVELKSRQYPPCIAIDKLKPTHRIGTTSLGHSYPASELPPIHRQRDYGGQTCLSISEIGQI
jgi:hypothetical protein